MRSLTDHWSQVLSQSQGMYTIPETRGCRSPTYTVWTTHAQPWSRKSVVSALDTEISAGLQVPGSNAREASLPLLPCVCSLFLDVSLCVRAAL